MTRPSSMSLKNREATDCKRPRTVRKLVTLPIETAERVERFRQAEGIPNESAALAALIEKALNYQCPWKMVEGRAEIVLSHLRP